MEYSNLKNDNLIFQKENFKNKYKIKNKILEDTTIVILAAGKGSRLNFNKNKFLFYYKKNERILDNYKKKLSQFKTFLFVVHKNDKEIIKELKKEFKNKNINFVYQFKRDGMASALYLCKDRIKTPNFLLMWCDQPYLKKNSIITLCDIHYKYSSLFSLTTCITKKPYINILRKNKIIYMIMNSRENQNVLNGETDTGLFIFDRDTIFRLLSKYINKKLILGKITREKNLLPLFPIISKKYGSVTLRLNNSSESIGINFRKDTIN